MNDNNSKLDILYILKKILNTDLFKEYIIIENDPDFIKECYAIEQSKFSLPLLVKNVEICNPSLNFFISLINFYQKLPKNSKNKPYACESHAITLRCLKKLSEQDIIELISHQRLSNYYDLSCERIMMGQEVPCVYNILHRIYFFKKRNIEEKDIPLIKSLLPLFQISLDNLDFIIKDEKFYITVKKSYIINNIKSGRSLKTFLKLLKNIKCSLEIEREYDNEKKKKSSKNLTLLK